MSGSTKKIVLPGYLVRRLEAFRVEQDGQTSYVLRDKVKGRTYDFDAWQFYLLEILPGLDRFDKVQAAFVDRFDRELTQRDFDEFIASVVDRKLLVDEAGENALLARFMRPSFDVQQGQAVARPTIETAAAATPARSPTAGGTSAAEALGAGAPGGDLPPGVQDALGLDYRSTEGMFGLFDPRPLLRLLLPVLLPLRHAVYLVPVLLLAAVMLLFHHWHVVVDDVRRLRFDFTLIQYLIFVFVTVRLCTTLASALIAQHYRLSVEKVGFTLAMGVIPRWTLKVNGSERLTRPQTMWLHGGNLLVRISLFAFGVLVWFNAHDSNAVLSQFGLLLALGSLAGLVIESANPLVKSHGYYLLSAFLNEAHLRGKAYAALMNKFKGGVYRASDSNLLAIYALLTSTYAVLVALLLARMLARFFSYDVEIGGTGMVIVVAFVAFALWRNYLSLKSFAASYERQLQFDRWRSRTVPVQAGGGEVERRKTSYWPTALLLVFVVVLFLPYPYEPGGKVMIQPALRQIITIDEGGLVGEVLHDGGETLKAGTVIGRIVNADHAAQISVLNARIDEQNAIVRDLKSLPKPQEVQLAQERLVLAQAQERFSSEREQRLRPLLAIEAVSREEYESALKQSTSDRQLVVQRQAELELVKAPVTASQIAASEARLASLIEERAGIEGRVQRAELRMPFDGNLLTLNLQNKVGSFLVRGDAFATIEDSSRVIAEIEIPEGDIGYVGVGDEVRIRADAFALDREFRGRVTLIDRDVTAKTTGNVIKVQAAIDDHDGLLRTGMGGRAKVLGESMPVWRAFTMAITRFIRVQVWSWIP